MAATQPQLKTLEQKIDKLTRVLQRAVDTGAFAARAVPELADTENRTAAGARYLGLSPATLAVWRTSWNLEEGTAGRGPRFTYLADGTPVYSREDLDAWRVGRSTEGKKRMVADDVGRPPKKRRTGAR